LSDFDLIIFDLKFFATFRLGPGLQIKITVLKGLVQRNFSNPWRSYNAFFKIPSHYYRWYRSALLCTMSSKLWNWSDQWHI